MDSDNSLILDGAYLAELEVGGNDEISRNGCATSCVLEYGSAETNLINGAGFVDFARLQDSGQYPYLEPGSYFLPLRLTNRLTDSTDNDGSGLRQNSNDVVLREFRITWTDSNGEELYLPGNNNDGVRPFFAYIPSGENFVGVEVPLLSGRIYPNATDNEAAFLAGALNDQLGARFGQAPTEVFVEIQAVGETNDGLTVESQIMRYPISVCNGCGVFNFTLSYCCLESDGRCTSFGVTPMCTRVEGG